MNDYTVKSAIAICVFNRPDLTIQVFNQIRKVKPEKLYIIADAPRIYNAEDNIRCKKVKAIFNDIDWDCDVKTNYATENMGCCKRLSSGFTWVFENEEKAIFLEDDCLPNIDFFRYCDEMLEKYSDDNRIMLVSGTNVLGKWNISADSYLFSKLGGIHGWASWRRAWKHFDLDITNWNNKNVKRLIKNKMGNTFYYQRCKIYDFLVNNSNNATAWAYQWGFARIVNNGLAIVPCVNLISNIGFGSDATHTLNATGKTAKLKVFEMKFPLKHPDYIIDDDVYDQKMFGILTGQRWIIFASYLKYIIKKCLARK